jgi:sugar lactone lactonase YvrE
MRTLLRDGNFFECPRWHQGRWWVSDMYRRVVLTVTPEGRADNILAVEGRPPGLGWMPDGSLLVVSMRERRILRRSPGDGVSEHADLSPHCGGDLNELVVDRRGVHTRATSASISRRARTRSRRLCWSWNRTAPPGSRPRTCASPTAR